MRGGGDARGRRNCAQGLIVRQGWALADVHCLGGAGAVCGGYGSGRHIPADGCEWLSWASLRRCAAHRRGQPGAYPLQQERGLPRLTALFDNWMQRTSTEIDSGCIYISGAVEFDDRPGPVRDALASTVNTWQAALRRAIEIAQSLQQLDPQADPQQVAFEIHGLILALHYEARFLRNPGAPERARKGFAQICARYTSTVSR